eukprot:201098-Rhodomonas_salina.5
MRPSRAPGQGAPRRCRAQEDGHRPRFHRRPQGGNSADTRCLCRAGDGGYSKGMGEREGDWCKG